MSTDIHTHTCRLYCQVFDLLMGGTGQELMQKLQDNTARFRHRMTDAGFTLKVSSYAIIVN